MHRNCKTASSRSDWDKPRRLSRTHFLASCCLSADGWTETTFPAVNFISTSVELVPGYHIRSTSCELLVSIVLTSGGPKRSISSARPSPSTISEGLTGLLAATGFADCLVTGRTIVPVSRIALVPSPLLFAAWLRIWLRFPKMPPIAPPAFFAPPAAATEEAAVAIEYSTIAWPRAAAAKNTAAERNAKSFMAGFYHTELSPKKQPSDRSPCPAPHAPLGSVHRVFH